jgi:hypothetical protein
MESFLCITLGDIEQVGLAVALYACIQEVLGSNFGWDADHPELFVAFLTASSQIMGQYLE